MNPPAGPRGRILVVDDDRALRHALTTLITDAGYLVAQAIDGPGALACLARAPADLMLLDLGLPGMSGLDVLARVRSLASPPRVVVVTADGRVILWNRAAERILGYTAREVVGRQCCDVLVGRDDHGNRLCYQGCHVQTLARMGESISPGPLPFLPNVRRWRPVLSKTRTLISFMSSA